MCEPGAVVRDAVPRVAAEPSGTATFHVATGDSHLVLRHATEERRDCAGRVLPIAVHDQDGVGLGLLDSVDDGACKAVPSGTAPDGVHLQMRAVAAAELLRRVVYCVDGCRSGAVVDDDDLIEDAGVCQGAVDAAQQFSDIALLVEGRDNNRGCRSHGACPFAELGELGAMWMYGSPDGWIDHAII